MRYDREHKTRTHERIVKAASRQFRAKGLNSPGVASLMKASGLTHGGFYKHFRGKEDLVVQALEESLNEICARMVEATRRGPASEGWKEIVNEYLSVGHLEHAELGCPIAALGSEISKAPSGVRKRIAPALKAYRERLVEFMPGGSKAEKQKNFMIIIATMSGAVAMARTLADPAEGRKVLDAVKEHILKSY